MLGYHSDCSDCSMQVENLLAGDAKTAAVGGECAWKTLFGSTDATKSSRQPGRVLLQWVGTALSVLGCIYLIAVIICVVQAFSRPETSLSVGYVLLATLFFLALGVWTRKASRSFQAITKTRGRDIDHLMEALDHLRKHYSLMSTVVKVYVTLILVVVIASIVVTLASSAGAP